MNDDPFTEQGKFTWFAHLICGPGWRSAGAWFSPPWERERNLREFASNSAVVLLGEFPTEKGAFDAAYAALVLWRERDAALRKYRARARARGRSRTREQRP
jgi:hypothetical protein